MRRATRITLAIMGGGLVVLGGIVAVAVEQTAPPCATAGATDARDACGTGGGHGGGAVAAGSRGTGAASAESERGGFGEAGAHAAGEGGGHGGGGE